MLTSDFRPKVEIWPFCTYSIKYMHYNPYYMNSLVIANSAMGQIPRFTEPLVIYKTAMCFFVIK